MADMQRWQALPQGTPNERLRERREDLLEWWMSELQRRLKAYLSQPTDAKRSALDQQLDQYRGAVESGQITPPRFSGS